MRWEDWGDKGRKEIRGRTAHGGDTRCLALNILSLDRVLLTSRRKQGNKDFCERVGVGTYQEGLKAGVEIPGKLFIGN